MKYTSLKQNLLCAMRHTPFYVNSRPLHTGSQQLVEIYFRENVDSFINLQCSKSTLGWDESIQQLMSKKELTIKVNVTYENFCTRFLNLKIFPGTFQTMIVMLQTISTQIFQMKIQPLTRGIRMKNTCLT